MIEKFFYFIGILIVEMLLFAFLLCLCIGAARISKSEWSKLQEITWKLAFVYWPILTGATLIISFVIIIMNS